MLIKAIIGIVIIVNLYETHKLKNFARDYKETFIDKQIEKIAKDPSDVKAIDLEKAKEYCLTVTYDNCSIISQ